MYNSGITRVRTIKIEIRTNIADIEFNKFPKLKLGDKLKTDITFSAVYFCRKKVYFWCNEIFVVISASVEILSHKTRVF